MSLSLATGIAATPAQQLAQSSPTTSSSSSSRLPPAAVTGAAATARLPPESLTLASSNVGHSTTHSTTRTSRARSGSPRSSASYRSLSPPTLSPAYDVDQSLPVPVDRGRPRLHRQPSLLPYRPPSGHDVSSVSVRAYLEPGPEVAQPRLVDVWTDVDPACLPRTAVALVSAPSAVVAHPARVDVAYARAYGMTSSGIRPTIVGVPCQPGLALPTVIDVARPPGPLLVDEPRPVGDDVRRPMPLMGERQSKSSVPVDVVKSPSGSTQPTRVDIVGQQGLGTPASVDNVRYPGPPLASVDVVRQPYLSSMSADVVVPQPGLQPAVSADGASSIVKPSLADVVYQPGSATADTVTDHPSTWTATQYVAARANVAEFASVGTMTAKSLRRLDRLTASSDSSPHSRVIEWLHTSESMPPPYSVVEPVPVSDRNRHCPSVPRQWCRVHALLAFLVFHIPHAVPKV